MRLKFSPLIVLLLCSFGVVAQSEYVDVVRFHDVQLKSQSTAESTLKILPFFDDFAYPYSKPLPSLWQDDDAFVNTAFAKNAKTIGVATLDAMDSNGKLHESVSTTPKISDYLTSLPINLKDYENIYSSDKLYRKDKNGFVLFDDTYFLYSHESNEYIPVIQGLAYRAGDTLYSQSGDSFVAIQDSVFDETKNYIDGSFSNEHIWHQYRLEDSLALSFYFQAGGYVDTPESGDSLVLEFYVPYDTSGVFLNEISASGVEIYNATDSMISLEGYFLIFDTLQNLVDADSLKFYALPDLTVSAYQHLVVSPSQFGIDSLTRAYAYLYSPDKTLIDSVCLNESLAQGVVYARMTDGNPVWSFTVSETMGECNPSWKWIWSTNKKTGDQFSSAFIPIDLPAYLVKGFRFRFKNYTSLSNDESHARNEDFWHLDLIWLNSNRSSENIDVPDVAFSAVVAPLYSKYKALPMSHFANVDPSEFRMTIPAKFTNFDSDYRKLKFNLMVRKLHNGDELLIPTYETDVPANTAASEADVLMDFVDEEVIPEFLAEDISVYDEGEYSFLYYFTDINNLLYSQYRWNDTCRTKLTLSNYYAYDDGTPEAGYGLRDAPMGRVAFKFDILQPDTLKAISCYFNPTMLNTNTTFNLCVWKNENGKPGDLVYYAPSERVKYAEGLYQFVDYEIDQANIVSGDENLVVGKSFFIGWEQPNDVLLNMGIDMNTTLNNRLYYNLGFEWENSVQKGALLLRPIFGSYVPTDIKSINQKEVKLYPTIAKDFVQIDSDLEIKTVEIFDLNGKIIKRTSKNFFSVTGFPDGNYVVKIQTKDNEVRYAQLIVVK